MNNKQNAEKFKIENALRNAYAEIQSNCMVGSPWVLLPELCALAAKIRLSHEEVAVLAVVFVRGEHRQFVDEKVCQQLLNAHCKVNGSRLRLVIRKMGSDGVLDITRDREMGCAAYSISLETQRAIDEDDDNGFKGSAPEGLDQLLQYVNRRLLDSDHMLERQVDEHIDAAKRHNENLKLVKYLQEKLFFCNMEEAFTLLAICTKAAFENEPFNYIYLDNYIHSSRTNIQRLRQDILDGTWLPIVEGLVEITGSNVMEFNPDLQLTDAGFDHFLSELDPVTLRMIRKKMSSVRTPLLESKAINKVDLFFSDELKRKTTRIAQLFSAGEFARYQAQIPKSARMRGLTVLFHGGPGCGKTEFALQLSRLTGRPLMKIQVTDFMSKWVGDSEANLKRVFLDYRRSCERLPLQPILFLNECDQIIGKRLSANTAVDQMTNAIQNILLEEMETFGGILIGTTNLTRNMDPAFERRWTMKLHFEAPNEHAIAAIWKSHIKGLRQTEAVILATQYKLTPGEIFNVGRRFAVEKLLGLEDTRLNTLLKLCATERYEAAQTARNPLGFNLPDRQEMGMREKKAG
jgi:hypothetical protein